MHTYSNLSYERRAKRYKRLFCSVKSSNEVTISRQNTVKIYCANLLKATLNSTVIVSPCGWIFAHIWEHGCREKEKLDVLWDRHVESYVLIRSRKSSAFFALFFPYFSYEAWNNIRNPRISIISYYKNIEHQWNYLIFVEVRDLFLK